MGLFRAHIVRPPGLAAHQDGPKPNCQIGGIKIRPLGRAVAADFDRPAVEAIADKIPDGEVRVEREIGAHEREAARQQAV